MSLTSSQLRQAFLDYFAKQGHKVVPSSSLVPANDPTLLFTNAGMVQFKDCFLGKDKRDYVRAVSSQRCVRAGGKHNDLENVGYTARHHTFFEMLGNFSFGDYFKKDAIHFGWELVTGTLGIDKKRLMVTVHDSDDEAYDLWHKMIGLAAEKIVRIGNKPDGTSDNFWQMGDTGPCGPCSEIFYDHGPKIPGGPPGSVDADGDRWVEIWNLVFMQFDRSADGKLTPLPKPSVDTGAGLDRISSVMQNVPSNYDTDLFVPIIERAVEVVGRPYDRGPVGAPFRVLADHARAVTFLLADGVFPSSDGRGYVLRRILRRAVRHAWLLGRHEPTLVHLGQKVIELMGGIYPELVAKRQHIERVTRAEEERFLETIDGGLGRLDELTGQSVIAGDEAFKLYDTFGFPLDLTQMIAGERGQKVDAEGFERALAAQRERSRSARRGTGGGPAVKRAASGDWVVVKPKEQQHWVGYETTRAETDVIAFRQEGDRVALVLRDNPFYAESGGQVSDTGVLKGEGWELTVEDVEKVDGKSAVVGAFGEPFEPTPVQAVVNEARRHNIERNHTGTHLVHAALRKIIGPSVGQQGSVVAPDRLRFDFSHHGPIDDATLARVEEEVNSHVWENLPINTQEMPFAQAKKLGAMAFFTEKYGDVVRVVEVPGVSLELCGGTHVAATGEIGLFNFTHETGVAAGVRRIEAVTGPGAFRYARELERRLQDAADLLKAHPDQLATRIEGLLEENKKLERRIQDLLRKGTGGENGGAVERIGDVELHLADSDLDDRTQIGLMMDAFRSRHKRAVSILFTTGERAGIHVAVTDDLVGQGIKAGEIANAIAAVSGGKGGGRPHFASAGAGDVAKLPLARARAAEIVRGILAA